MLNTSTKEMFLTVTKSHLFRVAFGVSLLFILSQISIPLHPVPITFQPTAVMILGLCFERRAAFDSVLAYLTLGAIGLPVFANFSGGWAKFIGPTGGYLLGFLVTVIVMGYVRQYVSKNNWLTRTFNCLLGQGIIFVCGLAWLSSFMGAEQAIAVGFLPFIYPGIIKAGLLVLALHYVKLEKIFG